MEISSYSNTAMLDVLRNHADADLSKVDAAGGIGAITEAMKHPSHIDDEEIQMQGVSVLSFLSADPSNQNSIVDAGGLEAIIQAMMRHSTCADLQLYGCDALSFLSMEEYSSRICEAGGIESIIQAMKLNKNVANLQYNACSSLSRLAHSNETRIAEIGSLGGMESLVDAINNHEADCELQTTASVVLHIVSSNDQNRSKIDAAAGVQAVIRAMNNYITMTDIDHNAAVTILFLQTLATFAYHDDMTMKVVETGGIESVIRVMKQHVDDPDIQHLGCYFLCNVSVEHDNASKTHIAGGDVVVLHAMNNFAENADLQGDACAALGNIASVSPDHLVSISDAGGVDAIINALKHHADDERLQYSALSALTLLTPSDDNNLKINAKGVIELIITAMNQYCEHADIPSTACELLGNIASNDEIRKSIIAAGAIATIENQAKRNRHNCREWYRLLGKLNYGDVADQSIANSNKRQKKNNIINQSIDQSIHESIHHQPEQTDHKAVDFLTTVRPSSLILDLLSNYEFYCVIPSLSRSHQSMMRNDVLHQHQCTSRLSMTDHQYQLFRESRFPLLYLPLNKIEAVSDAHQLNNQSNSETTQSNDKIWWLECSRLFFHLAYTTRFLTRHAPTHFRMTDGHLVAIRYELPRLIQSVLIDHLTSFYIFNLLRRYVDDGYHDTVMFESNYRRRKANVEDHARVWHDYTKDFDVTHHIPLKYCEGEFYQTSRHESDDNRLKFLRGESLFLGDSPARGCGAFEYSHYLWFGPSLKKVADELVSSTHHPQSVTVTMESAVPFHFNIKNGRDLPYIITPDVQSWIMSAGMSLGRIKPCEMFRLYKFIHGDRFIEHWNWNTLKGKLLEDEQKDEDENNRSETTYGVHSLECQSAWWSREQKMWKDMIASRPLHINDNDNNNNDPKDAEPMIDETSSHIYSEMFQQYLYFIAETAI